jgi:hypothetical protein
MARTKESQNFMTQKLQASYTASCWPTGLVSIIAEEAVMTGKELAETAEQLAEARVAISRLDETYDKLLVDLLKRIKDPIELASAISEIEPDYLEQRNLLVRVEQRWLGKLQ